MKPSIAEILRSIDPLPPELKAARLRAFISNEPHTRGVRKAELIRALQHVVNTSLTETNRTEKKGIRNDPSRLGSESVTASPIY